jgi:hypothetical protein
MALTPKRGGLVVFRAHKSYARDGYSMRLGRRGTGIFWVGRVEEVRDDQTLRVRWYRVADVRRGWRQSLQRDVMSPRGLVATFEAFDRRYGAPDVPQAVIDAIDAAA